MNSDDLEYLVGRSEGRLRRAWREMIREIQDENSLGELADKIAAGDLDGVLAGVQDAAEKFALDVNGGYVAAGQKTARWLDAELDSKVRFDFASDSAVDWLTSHGDEFVRGVVADQQAMVEQVIAHGRARGLSDMDIAEEVRDSIGLTARQVDFVESYRSAITQQDYRNALDRALGDGRYERALERAAEGGTTVAADRVDSMVSAYRRNWIGYRGDAIAAHEAQQATHAGMEEMLQQAVDSDDVESGNVARTWNTMHDSHVRGSHYAMDGQVQPAGAPFESGMGNLLMYPGDDSAPFDDTANCRCYVTVALVKPEDEDQKRSAFRLVDSLPA